MINQVSNNLQQEPFVDKKVAYIKDIWQEGYLRWPGEFVIDSSKKAIDYANENYHVPKELVVITFKGSKPLPLTQISPHVYEKRSVHEVDFKWLENIVVGITGQLSLSDIPVLDTYIKNILKQTFGNYNYKLLRVIPTNNNQNITITEFVYKPTSD